VCKVTEGEGARRCLSLSQEGREKALKMVSVAHLSDLFLESEPVSMSRTVSSESFSETMRQCSAKLHHVDAPNHFLLYILCYSMLFCCIFKESIRQKQSIGKVPNHAHREQLGGAWVRLAVLL
jgi:hypothetical protein